jgi:hypothetical protein
MSGEHLWANHLHLNRSRLRFPLEKQALAFSAALQTSVNCTTSQCGGKLKSERDTNANVKLTATVEWRQSFLAGSHHSRQLHADSDLSRHL